MGAWVARALLVIAFVSVAAPTVALHNEPPVQYELALARTGWFAARFEPGASNLTLGIYAFSEGTALHQFVLFDDQDRPIGSFYALREDFAAYARLTASGLHREVRVPYAGGGAASGGGTGIPCAAWYGTLWSSSGEIGTSVQVPPVCDGRPVRGVIVSSLGNWMYDLRLEIRSLDPIDVRAAVANAGGAFLDTSQFDGTAAEVSVPALFLDPAVSTGDAQASASIGKGLYGAFVASQTFAPGVHAELSYSHAGSTGACPCSWAGGEATRGEWTFARSGTSTTPIYLAYVDAELPAPKVTPS